MIRLGDHRIRVFRAGVVAACRWLVETARARLGAAKAAAEPLGNHGLDTIYTGIGENVRYQNIGIGVPGTGGITSEAWCDSVPMELAAEVN